MELTGFDAQEIAGFIAGEEFPGQDGLTPDDDAPGLREEAVTQRGELWLLGDHRLLCGDATDVADVERALCGARDDLVIIDPHLRTGGGQTVTVKHVTQQIAVTEGGQASDRRTELRRPLFGVLKLSAQASARYGPLQQVPGQRTREEAAPKLHSYCGRLATPCSSVLSEKYV